MCTDCKEPCIEACYKVVEQTCGRVVDRQDFPRKRDFIIEKHLALHFLYYSEYPSTPLSF